MPKKEKNLMNRLSGELTQRVGRYEKKLVFLPSFDKRHVNPKKNYGRHCSDMIFVLRNLAKNQAVTFRIFTGWNFDHSFHTIKPIGASIDLHSPTPHYKGQKSYGKCQFIGTKCYVDGSSLNAEPIFDILNSKGIEAMWKEMEKWFR